MKPDHEFVRKPHRSTWAGCAVCGYMHTEKRACNTCGKPLGPAWEIHCPHCGAQVQEDRR